MSMRVKLKDASVLGLTRFSIQKNESRAFPYDQVFGELSKSIGNIAPYQLLLVLMLTVNIGEL